MEIEIQKISSLLSVIEYADVETSLTELMEKSCQIIKQYLQNNNCGGEGQWTWSVFSVRNITIEQKAVGGTHAALRIALPKRDAKFGMIALVIKPDESTFIYEEDTEQLPEEKFLRILNNTKSAVVARIERNNDIVGVINIESDCVKDFDREITRHVLEYISNIISPILSIDDYRNILQKHNSMFSGVLAIIENHSKTTLEVFFKAVVDTFCFEFRLEASALFVGLDSSKFQLAAHSYLDNYSKSCEMGKTFTCDKTLLTRSIAATSNAPISKQNIKFSELVGINNVDIDDDGQINFVRLYKFDIHTEFKYVLVAISNNQSNPPDITNAKRYSRLIESFTRTYFELENNRLEKQEAVLVGELYSLAISENSHYTFLEAAAEKLNTMLNATACFILLVRSTTENKKPITQDSKYFLVTEVGSSYAKNTLDSGDIVDFLNTTASEVTGYNQPILITNDFMMLGSTRHTKVDIVIEPFDDKVELQSDIQIIVCLADSNQLSTNRIYKKVLGVDIQNSLLTIIKEIRLCMQLINNSIKILDTRSGFEIIHKIAKKIEVSKNFDDLAKTLHLMYGTTYQAGDEETLSSVVQMLDNSYFSIFRLEDDGRIRMSDISKKLTQLPPSSPEFVRGDGLTGKVIDAENGETFVSRVEATSGADLNCKSYWNKILSTQFRYFYGKKIEFDNTIGVLAIIGARTPYFQEQIFEGTIKSLFGVLADIIHASGKRLSVSESNYYPLITKKIINNNGNMAKNIFLMIPFEGKDKYKNIREIIRNSIKEAGYNLLIADECQYAAALNENLVAYMDACKYGIAIFDSNMVNPNIAYELGYMYKSFSKCLILKDKNAEITQADFVPLIFEQVDFDQLATIPPKLEKWIKSLQSSDQPLRHQV